MKRPSEYSLEMHNIVTQRGGFALRVAKLELSAGTIACLVGPNGCGKTTLLLTALGLLPHRGVCRIGGLPYDGREPEVRARLGFIPDDLDLLFEELTAREQWGLTASLLANLRPGSTHQGLLLQAAQLARSLAFDPPTAISRSYSHGMRKKMQIVDALIGTPPVIIVDELRNGLDPVGIHQAEQLIQRERERGATVLAATHDLWWAERFSDYVYVLHRGTIVAEGPPQKLIRRQERSLEEAFFRIIGVAS